MSVERTVKVIIVEGLTDKVELEKIIKEDVTIICTNGTLGVEKFDELLDTYDLDYRDVFVFVDEDKPGLHLRQLLKRELPHAEHIYVSSHYKEVATTPADVLAQALAAKNIDVHPFFLM